MNPLDQLLHDAMTEHTESVPHLRAGAAHRALVRGRRRRTATIAAAGTAGLAATAGIGAFVVSQQPTGSVELPPGGAPVPTVSAAALTSAAPTTSAGPANAQAAASAAVGEVLDGTTVPASEISQPGSESEAPAELRKVTLTGPVAGFTITGAPGGSPGATPLYERRAGTWSKSYWFAPEGASASSGSSGGVRITEGVALPTANPSSPSPQVSTTTIDGRPGTVWLSGGDREIYYRAGEFTVEVDAVDSSITLAQLEAIGDAVQGLPQ